jgi:SAM-dependent MidA family methyltransferase
LNKLNEIIGAELAREGALPFARFMELALYCPVYGYYESEKDKIGRKGDFYTSVSVGPLFGEMLAFQFCEWLDQLAVAARNETDTVLPARVCEAGAHNGRLAFDILNWVRLQRPDLSSGFTYYIIEPSKVRRAWQAETLAPFIDHVRWLEAGQFPTPFRGVFFSNELLDAMPQHRLGWDGRRRRWFEWGVSGTPERLDWIRLPLPDRGQAGAGFLDLVPEVPDELAEVLPEEFTIEVSPAATAWWSRAASSLAEGKLLTIDYGYEAEGRLQPERPAGTLRAYRNHQASADLLAVPGQQDLTAHIDFSQIRRTGEAQGLQTDALISQELFFTRIARETWLPHGQAVFGDWTSVRTRQFQTLTHPNYLGRAFRVLLQSRGTDSPR